MTDVFSPSDPTEAPKPVGGKLHFSLPKILAGRNGLANRNRLAQEIVQMVQADETTQQGINTAADEVDELYLGRSVESLTPLWEGAPTYNAKTLGNKVKQLVSFVSGPMVGLDPFFVLRAGGPKGNPIDAVQSVLHFFLYKAKYPLALDEACNLIARRGRCPVRVTYEGRREGLDGRVKKGRLKLLPLDARFCRIYPNSASSIEDARLFGYVYQERVRVVDEHQRAGRYVADTKIRSGAEKIQTMGSESTDKQPGGTNSVYREDDPVDLIEAVVRKDLDGDGFEELYRVVVAKYQRVLLRIELFQLDRPWYADLFFERETGRFRPENSVGIDLSDVHHFVNDNLNLQVWLSMYAAAPPMFGDSWALPDEVIQTRPGELVGIEGGGKVFSNQGRVDLAAFPALYQIGRNISDECAKVSQNGLGANLSPGTTATEASQVAQGQSVGIKGYSSKLGFGCVEIAEIALELLWRNFDDWYPDYQGVLPGVSRDDLMQEFWIEVNGDTPVDTPQAAMQQITMFTQSLAQLMQMNPQIMQRYPDLIPNLLRSMLESTEIPNKESILPTREEEAAQQQQQMQQQQLLAMIQQHVQQLGNPQAGQQPDPFGNAGPVQQPPMGLPQGAMGPQAGPVGFGGPGQGPGFGGGGVGPPPGLG